MQINDNFEKLPESYLFSTVAGKLRTFSAEHPDAEVIRMDIGDVTRPLAPCVISAMHRAVDDMAQDDTFRGYGPEQGYAFLREAIARVDYRERGVEIDADDIFISDGAKSDLGNLGDIFSPKTIVGVTDPVYPVYVDSNVMDGRGGYLDGDRWSNIMYIDCSATTDFKPHVPDRRVDVVYLCSPNNPTGTALSRIELEEWVAYARRNRTLIIFDSAYEAYVRDPEIPRSIYEIEGAKEVAIEVRSFSKTAGFTGIRCGYTVVPAELAGTDRDGREVSLKKMWMRRQTTKFNGASYIAQRAAEALYTPEGREAVRETTDYYLHNAKAIRDMMREIGYEVYGGENSPYVWVSTGGKASSWDIFDDLLSRAKVSCTPGVGFGRNGEGYIRLTGFNSEENTVRAMRRIAGSRR